MYNSPLRKKEVHTFTPLMLAVAAKESQKSDTGLECVKLLMKYGADINCKDGDGNTILHIAARFKNNKVMKYIINCDQTRGIFKEKNKAGNTALITCQKVKNLEGTRILESHHNSEQLLQDLQQEQALFEEAKERRRLKRMRNRLNKQDKRKEQDKEQLDPKAEKEQREKEKDK